MTAQSSGDGPGSSDPREVVRAVNEQLEKLELRIKQETSGRSSVPKAPASLDDAFRGVRLKRREADLQLSKVVGYGMVILMGAQVLIVDAAFYVYGASNDWYIPGTVVDAWLAAGVIQVIGSVVLVITRHLFSGTGDDTTD